MVPFKGGLLSPLLGHGRVDAASDLRLSHPTPSGLAGSLCKGLNA